MIWTVKRLGRLGDGIAIGPDSQQALSARTLPGETIEGSATNGRIIAPKIIAPTADRISAACPHYAACGGCSLMHARDEFVSQWKTDLVTSALAAHGIDATIGGIAVSPERSRRRAVLSGRRTKQGALLGFHGRASDKIADVTDCRILRPHITSAFPILRKIIAAGGSRGRELRLNVTETLTGLDVAISGGKLLDQQLSANLPRLMEAAGIARLDWAGTTLTRCAPELRMGRARVTPPPGAFLQATAEGETALRTVVQKELQGAVRIVDLFAGCGTFTLPLAAAEVHAVEGLAAPLHALDAALRNTPGLRHITTEMRDLAIRPMMPDELTRFDASVIDPPRTGASAQARQLAASNIARIAWVSCDPVSFARDTKTMIDGGYHMGSVYIVDQFRWSPHVETVCCFTRN